MKILLIFRTRFRIQEKKALLEAQRVTTNVLASNLNLI